MMATMIERVARAICAADPCAPAPDDPILIGMRSAKAWEARIPLAVAAIEALREPTDQMLEDAGCMDGYDFDRIAPDQDHVEWWSAMIDAALKEG